MSKGSNTTRSGGASTRVASSNGGSVKPTIGRRILRNGEYVQEQNLSQELFPNLGGMSPKSQFDKELSEMTYSASSYDGLRNKLKEERDNALLYNRKFRYNVDKGFTKAQTKAQKEAEFKAIENRKEQINKEYKSRLKEVEDRILKLEKNASTSQIWDFNKARG